jgi:hypothetical protein
MNRFNGKERFGSKMPVATFSRSHRDGNTRQLHKEASCQGPKSYVTFSMFHAKYNDELEQMAGSAIDPLAVYSTAIPSENLLGVPENSSERVNLYLDKPY